MSDDSADDASNVVELVRHRVTGERRERDDLAPHYDTRADAAAAYEASERFLYDARDAVVDWFLASDPHTVHPTLQDQIRRFYHGLPAYETAIDDLMAGDR